MPSGEDEAFQSVVGLESQTTRHFPSRTIGSVSFWALATSEITAQLSSSMRGFTMALPLSLSLWQRRFEKRRPSPAPRKFPSPSTGLPRRRRVWRCEILLLDPDMCHIRARQQTTTRKKRIRIKSKPSFGSAEITDCGLCVSFSGRLYLKRVDETKVDHVECFREDCSSLRGESVDKSSIALTPTPNNASDNSCTPQWCAACVRAQPSALRTLMG